MKPTGATKEVRELIRPLPWAMNANRAQTFDISDEAGFPIGQFYDRAEATYMITAVNEREQLREALRGVAIMLNTELEKYDKEPWAQRVRAALSDQKG